MFKIKELKGKFDNLFNLRNYILCVFEEMETKLSVLKNIYKNIIKTHNNNVNAIFGIDSFYFQNMLIEKDYKDLKQNFQAIENRIYCEYYNLYKCINNYIKNDIFMPEIISKINNNNYIFPPYKQLDPYKKYDIVLIKELHNLIMLSLYELENIYNDNEVKVKVDNQYSSYGINIDNLVNNSIYNNLLLKTQIDMFINYMNVFHSHHKKYFARLLLKTKLHMGIITEDIVIKKIKPAEKPDDINKIIQRPSSTAISMEDGKYIRSFIKVDNNSPSAMELNSIIKNSTPLNKTPKFIPPPHISETDSDTTNSESEVETDIEISENIIIQQTEEEQNEEQNEEQTEEQIEEQIEEQTEEQTEEQNEERENYKNNELIINQSNMNICDLSNADNITELSNNIIYDLSQDLHKISEN